MRVRLILIALALAACGSRSAPRPVLGDADAGPGREGEAEAEAESEPGAEAESEAEADAESECEAGLANVCECCIGDPSCDGDIGRRVEFCKSDSMCSSLCGQFADAGCREVEPFCGFFADGAGGGGGGPGPGGERCGERCFAAAVRVDECCDWGASEEELRARAEDCCRAPDCHGFCPLVRDWECDEIEAAGLCEGGP